MGVNNSNVHNYIQTALDNNWQGRTVNRPSAAFDEVTDPYEVNNTLEH